MNTQEIIISQNRAALAMFKQTVERCPDSLWNNPNDKTRFWHIAYHVLFYVHLYLQPTDADFKPWSKHREQYQFMGPVPCPPHDTPKIGEPYSKEDVLEYLAFCRDDIEEGRFEPFRRARLEGYARGLDG